MKKLIVLLIVILSASGAYAQSTASSLKAGEQRSAEKGLHDNEYYIYFLNSTITNIGTDEEKILYKEIIERDIISHFLYMRFMFPEAFKEIRRNQELLIDLYTRLIKRESAYVFSLLNQVAPDVIYSDNSSAELYLALGYRNIKEGEIKLLMSDNFREKLYSLRLYKYVHSFKNIKEAKRYAIKGFVAARLKIQDRKKLESFGYDEIKVSIESAAGERKDEYLLQHTDSFYKIKDEKSFYDVVWNQSESALIKDYTEKLKETKKEQE